MKQYIEQRIKELNDKLTIAIREQDYISSSFYYFAIAELEKCLKYDAIHMH